VSENETKLKITNLKNLNSLLYANTNLIFILFSMPAWLSLLLSKIEYLIKNFNKIEKLFDIRLLSRCKKQNLESLMIPIRVIYLVNILYQFHN
jgi:hypothetical protein